MYKVFVDWTGQVIIRASAGSTMASFLQFCKRLLYIGKVMDANVLGTITATAYIEAKGWKEEYQTYLTKRRIPVEGGTNAVQNIPVVQRKDDQDQ